MYVSDVTRREREAVENFSSGSNYFLSFFFKMTYAVECSCWLTSLECDTAHAASRRRIMTEVTPSSFFSDIFHHFLDSAVANNYSHVQ